jgi:site-specific recombinase XerD
VEPAGFEPATTDSGGSQFFRIANLDELLSRFKEFGLVDRNLSENTMNSNCGYLFQIKRFLKAVGKEPSQISTDEVRTYLLRFQDKSPNTKANCLKALRLFFRFLGRPQVVESFKFPRRTYTPKSVPSNSDLAKFFDALEKDRDRLLFLLFASSGLRRSEVLSLSGEDLDLKTRTITPKNHKTGTTKNSWVSFYNQEAESYLRNYLTTRTETSDNRLFPFGGIVIRRAFKKATLKTGIRITPQVLRFWFANEMSRLGMSDRFIDALQGRTPRSVLARHYSDFSVERLKESYKKANLRVLD